MQDYVLKSEIMRQWRADAIAEGAERARTETLRAMARNVLVARGWSVDEGIDARLSGTEDAGTLERWALRAVTATAIEDVFAD